MKTQIEANTHEKTNSHCNVDALHKYTINSLCTYENTDIMSVGVSVAVGLSKSGTLI